MAIVKGMLIDVDYITRNGNVVIRLVLKRKRYFRLYDDTFSPYFYLYSEDLDNTASEFKKFKTMDKNREIKVKDIVKVNKVLNGKETTILKVICYHPQHVPILREKAKELGVPYEHDIPFARRYIVDKGLVPFSLLTMEAENKHIKRIISQEETNKKINSMTFDIETYNPLGKPREDKDPAIMIGYANGGSGILTYGKINLPYVTNFSNEKGMIEAFSRMLKEKDVEMLIGYNSTTFDLPYLNARSKKVNAKFTLGRDGSTFKVKRRGMYNVAKITGRIHMDLYLVVRFLGVIGMLKTYKYTLRDVYEELIGKEKTSVKKVEIYKLWDDERGKEILADYCKNDAEATKELADKILPVEIELSKLVGVPLFDVYGGSTGKLVEILLVNRAFNANMVVPNNPHEGEVKSRSTHFIQGAYVKIPNPGIYDNIMVFDFRGLYPSIIVSHNVDPFTLNCPCCNEKEVHTAPTGAKFCSKKKGITPNMLEELIDKRIGIKKQLKQINRDSDQYVSLDARQQALKILSNSVYGMYGYARSRWYSLECGEAVTAWGRHYIQETAKKAEENGFSVLYIDTDSLFIQLNNKTKQDALSFIKEINTTLPERMELELEDFYTRGVFVSKKGEERGAKKKYALLSEKGNIKIRGFELVRRDWSKIAKDTQLQVLEAILKEGSKEKAVEIVRDKINELKSGSAKIEDLVIYTQLKKNVANYDIMSPEVAAAQKAIKIGMELEEGSLIAYVITKKGKSISDKAQPIELAKDYDAQYYIDHQ
ncbi:ribonuclease H-like domain-containing protein, partial [Candidatus Micrarchaeota archaeon]|nr:ribonuclease H-like domain-containing protein [Candidatus Micrarchaeota archaeon]